VTRRRLAPEFGESRIVSKDRSRKQSSLGEVHEKDSLNGLFLEESMIVDR
jgi:hypothetical protein